MADFDISIIGDKELARKLAKLPDLVERKIVAKVLGGSRTRLKREIHTTMTSGFFKEPTGALAAVFKATRMMSRTKRGFIMRGFAQPESAEEAIKMNAVEYGHKTKGGGFVPPTPFIRSTVNRMEAQELQRMGREIGSGIERIAKR